MSREPFFTVTVLVSQNPKPVVELGVLYEDEVLDEAGVQIVKLQLKFKVLGLEETCRNS